jgi:nitrogen fixation NifU-like protein
MHTPQLLDHFQNPRNTGELEPPAITVLVENPACGDIMRLSARVESGRILRATYQVRGCTASIAAGSVLTELLSGVTLEQAAAISASAIDRVLGGLPPESRHASVLAADAVKNLLERLK